VLGTAVVDGASSDGGADGAASINPVGAFFLGFGRGFFVAAAGSACVSPLEVEATALSAMVVVVVKGSGCGGFVVFRDRKMSGRSMGVAVSRDRGGKMAVGVKEQTFWAKEIFLVLGIRNEVEQSHFPRLDDAWASQSSNSRA